MQAKVGFGVVAAVIVLGVVVYMSWRSPAPAPARGEEPPETVFDKVAEARAIVDRINARSELTLSANPLVPGAERTAGVLQRRPEAQEEVDEQKAAAALQKLRAQMEFERQTTREPIPKVGAIMGGAGGRFQALIGDGFVSEGEVVKGYRVKKIQADSVEFERDGQTWTQKVN